MHRDTPLMEFIKNRRGVLRHPLIWFLFYFNPNVGASVELVLPYALLLELQERLFIFVVLVLPVRRGNWCCW